MKKSLVLFLTSLTLLSACDYHADQTESYTSDVIKSKSFEECTIHCNSLIKNKNDTKISPLFSEGDNICKCMVYRK